MAEWMEKAVEEVIALASSEMAFKTGAKALEVAIKHKFGVKVIATFTRKVFGFAKHEIEVIEVEIVGDFSGLWHWAVTDHELNYFNPYVALDRLEEL